MSDYEHRKREAVKALSVLCDYIQDNDEEDVILNAIIDTVDGNGTNRCIINRLGGYILDVTAWHFDANNQPRPKDYCTPEYYKRRSVL